MFKSRTISIYIDRPFEEVYAFLIEPRNFPRWGPMHGEHFEALGGRDYLVDLPSGRSVLGFSEPNRFGVLDFTVTHPGKAPVTSPARLYHNDGGCELALVMMRRTGVSEEKFASDVEWMSTDLATLKSLLESRAVAEPAGGGLRSVH